MPDVFVGAGSNADPVPRLRAGVQELTLRFGAVRCSSVYRGPALGATAAADYWNLVVMLRTDMGLDALRAELRAIEQLAGRQRADPAVELDLDLLLYDDVEVTLDTLTSVLVADGAITLDDLCAGTTAKRCVRWGLR